MIKTTITILIIYNNNHIKIPGSAWVGEEGRRKVTLVL